MAFSEEDKKLLQELPGKTKIVAGHEVSGQSTHKIEITSSKGIKSTIKANSIEELIKGLEEKAKSFEPNAEMQKFLKDIQTSKGVQELNKIGEETKANLKKNLAKVPQDLKLRAEILRAYLNAQPDLMYKKIDELQKFEGEPIRPFYEAL